MVKNGRMEGNLPLRCITEWTETPSLFLITYGREFRFAIPKRLLEPGQEGSGCVLSAGENGRNKKIKPWKDERRGESPLREREDGIWTTGTRKNPFDELEPMTNKEPKADYHAETADPYPTEPVSAEEAPAVPPPFSGDAPRGNRMPETAVWPPSGGFEPGEYIRFNEEVSRTSGLLRFRKGQIILFAVMAVSVWG